MIFIKLLLTVAAIVHLVACSDDAEGSSTSTSFEVNSTPQYDDITESNENSSSDVSTIESVTEQITEPTSISSTIESSTEPDTTTVVSVKIARSASYELKQGELPLQSVYAGQPPYSEPPAMCSCPCQSQPSQPYYPGPDPVPQQAVTYEDKHIEHARDSYAHHAEYLPAPLPQPPSYSPPPQPQPASYALPQIYSPSPPPQTTRYAPLPPRYSPPQPTPQTYTPPQAAPQTYTPPQPAPQTYTPPQAAPQTYTPPQPAPQTYTPSAPLTVPAKSPPLSYPQPFPCPKNILVSCAPRVQQVPCISPY